MNPVRILGWYVAALTWAAARAVLRPQVEPRVEAQLAAAFANELLGYR